MTPARRREIERMAKPRDSEPILATLRLREALAEVLAELPVPEPEVIASDGAYRVVNANGEFRHQMKLSDDTWVDSNDWHSAHMHVCAEEILRLRAEIAELNASRPLEVGDRVRHRRRHESGKVHSLWIHWDRGLAGLCDPSDLTRIEAQP